MANNSSQINQLESRLRHLEAQTAQRERDLKAATELTAKENKDKAQRDALIAQTRGSGKQEGKQEEGKQTKQEEGAARRIPGGNIKLDGERFGNCDTWNPDGLAQNPRRRLPRMG